MRASNLNKGKADPLLRGVIDRRRCRTLAFCTEHPRVVEPKQAAADRRMTGKGRNAMEALIVGLVSIAVIWLVVIYGSLYMNKNVQ
jgi:hypothetical protein